jgi:PQQ-like domain
VKVAGKPALGARQALWARQALRARSAPWARSALWVRRALLAIVLVGAAVIPGRASSLEPQHCTGLRCRAAGSILWTRPLPGSWTAQPGVAGTISSQGPAYAAIGGGDAVVGSGTMVTAFAATTGQPLWQVSVTGVPAGFAIVGVRAFPGVVAVGMAAPASQAAGQAQRDEVILSAATGQHLRVYPAASYGGAIYADGARTVVVGIRAITAYANATGRVLWSRATGPPEQTWRVFGQYVYVTESPSGYVGASSVTALRRISLRTGVERIVRPASSAFPGTFSGAVDGVVLFSGTDGVWAYSGLTGKRLWHRQAAVLELTDTAHGTVYLDIGNTLMGVDVASGVSASSAAASVAASLYTVTDGVALGIDQDALGEAWGYDLSTRRVVWTSGALPWPHFFVDLSGLGGSASPGSDIVMLAICAKVGAAPTPGSAPACLRPELAAVLV